MSQTVTNETLQFEYKGTPTPTSNLVLMYEFDYMAISTTVVMIEYAERDDRLKTLPLLGVG